MYLVCPFVHNGLPPDDGAKRGFRVHPGKHGGGESRPADVDLYKSELISGIPVRQRVAFIAVFSQRFSCHRYPAEIQ